MFRASANQTNRTGVAAVEMAVVLPLLVLLMIGVWEMGRVVHLQQIVANSAREGARLAAQSRTINATGNPTEIRSSILPASNTNSLPNVEAAVMQSLHGAGLDNLRWDTDGTTSNNDVIVRFEFLDGDTSLTEPHQGVKNQRFRVTVTITNQGYQRVRWLNFGLVNPDTVSYAVDWRILVDDPFTVNTTMPTW